MTPESRAILIIDDDPLFLDRLKNLLQGEYLCYSALNARRGLELVDELSTSNLLVICDVDLPDMIGFDVCRTIKSINPGTVVLLMTGFNSLDLRMRGLGAYADNCLDKSLKDVEIELLIRNAHNTMRPRIAIERPTYSVSGRSTMIPTDFEVKVLEYIDTYYEKPGVSRDSRQLSLSTISEQFLLDERGFQRKIRDIAGCTYKSFLTRTRLEKSKRLLESNLSVTEISQRLDYSSPSHFARDFKKHTSMTPNGYRKIQGKLR